MIPIHVVGINIISLVPVVFQYDSTVVVAEDIRVAVLVLILEHAGVVERPDGRTILDLAVLVVETSPPLGPDVLDELRQGHSRIIGRLLLLRFVV